MKIIIALIGAASAISINRWDRKYDEDHPHPGFGADSDGFEGRWFYKRVIPDNYQGGGSGDDQFMNSMIKNYAMEKATPDGHPTGDFYFNKMSALMAAQEVVGTHLKLEGQAK